jgi:ribonuclease HI
MSEEVVIYSDGGADPNPGPGGWAAIVRYSDGVEQVLTGNAPQTTNNRMELTAVIEALRALPQSSRVAVNTDSQYVRRGIGEWLPGWVAAGWRTRSGRPVANADLWRVLREQAARHTIDWRWVRGHSGNPDNERVDRLARAARGGDASLPAAAGVPTYYLRAACHGNPGPGAWGIAVEEDGQWQFYSGTAPYTTNNRMELTAAIEALAIVPAGGRVRLVTTSEYLYQGATRYLAGWQARGWTRADGHPIANADLWRQLAATMARAHPEWISAKGQRLDGLKRAGEALRQRDGNNSVTT